MAIFSELDVWFDPQARDAAENMAVDQLLLESGLEKPLIRFYQWSEPSVSFGYFERFSDAKRDFPGEELSYVRRWTGGGIVDHRVDQTYSIFLPKGHAVEQLRGDKSYEEIHRALAESLLESGVSCQLITESSGSDARSCFVNPVAYDIVGNDGTKLAGAGQKRSRYGMLHQGSVQGVVDVSRWQRAFLESLSTEVHKKDINPAMLGDVSKLASERYAAEDWLLKR